MENMTLHELLIYFNKKARKLHKVEVDLIGDYLFCNAELPYFRRKALKKTVEYLKDICEENEITSVEGIMKYYNDMNDRVMVKIQLLKQQTNN